MKMKRKQWSKANAFLLILAICFGTPLLQLPAVEAQAASTTEEPEPWGDYDYTISEDNTVAITGYKGDATELQIPAEIEGYPVTRIEDLAFFNCISLTSIDIPDSVTSIGSSVFYNCSNLSAINADLNNPVYASVAGVLFNKELTTVIICPPKKEGTYSIPDGVTSIGDSAFTWCSSLTNIVLPETVTKIGTGAFVDSGLESITITANEIEIAEDAFIGRDNLTIRCLSASKAYAFAQNHGIVVELLDAKPDILYGDLDGSGDVDANDALLILKIAAKLQILTEEQRIAGDVDESGNVDANDALDVLKKAAKLIDVFSAEVK